MYNIQNILKIGRVMLTVFFYGIISQIDAQYFQQKVDYEIDVTLNSQSNTLKANMIMSYTNNSTQALNEVYMHLWPNAYASHKTPLGRQVKEHANRKILNKEGQISGVEFSVNGEVISHRYWDKNKEVAIVPLKKPLQPGETLQLSTPFEVRLPAGDISRMGYVTTFTDQGAIMATQWYPKPAVYDAKGWNPMYYLSQGEFYSEFGSFDVKITLPSNYVVGATGELQTETEKEFLKYKISKEKLKNPYEATGTKTIQFKQDNIHDFAWFADTRFIVDADTAKLSNGKEVVCLAMYTPENEQEWDHAARMIKNSVHYYSERIGYYPYAYCTAVDGTISAGGGMEYPMVTIIGESEVERTILHEVGHNWFYGILGSNERAHPWMDEGINSYFENAYYQDSTRNEGQNGGLMAKVMDMISGDKANEMIHLWMSRHQKHQPLQLHSEEYSYVNYGIEVYMHTAAMFRFLESNLGRQAFDTAFKDYYREWAFKHPQPEDIQKSFEKSTGKDLDWFFNGLLKEHAKPDFKVGYKHGKMEISHDFPTNLPAKVSVYKGKDLLGEYWVEPFLGSMKLDIDPQATKILINENSSLWEKNKMNNELEPQKACKTCDPVRVSPLMSFPSLTKNYISISPTYLWNNYNKSMLGISIHNKGILPKRHEFYVLPLISFNPASFAFYGDYKYRIWPDKSKIAYLDFGINYRRFAWDFTEKALPFNRLEARVTGEFKRKNKALPRRSGIDIRYTLIQKDMGNLWSGMGIKDISYSVLMGEYWYENFDRKFPLFVRAGIEAKQEFEPRQGALPISAKIWGEATQSIVYMKRKKLSIRGFAAFYLENRQSYVNNRIQLNGWSGMNDYAMQYMYFGRSDRAGSFTGNQFIEREGNFKIYAPVGQSNLFLGTINLKFDLPIPYFPVGVYGDMGLSVNRHKSILNGVATQGYDYRFYANAGLYIDIMPQILSIYFPIPQATTQNMHFVNNNFKDPYYSYIRFSLNLLKLNPYNFKEFVRMIK